MEDRSEVEEGIEYETIFQIDEIDVDTRKEEERQKLYAQVTEEKLAKIPVFTGRRESGINIFETLAAFKPSLAILFRRLPKPRATTLSDISKTDSATSPTIRARLTYPPISRA